MRCRSCGKRWHLRDDMGPGGAASPGQYFVVALGVLAAAAVLDFYSALGAVIVGAVGLLVLIMALSGCGYQRRATAYQGSECPSCGQRNWIWPWNF